MLRRVFHRAEQTEQTEQTETEQTMADPLPEAAEDVMPVGEVGEVGEDRLGGPWDAADQPDDELPRVDLGGLRVPVLPDVELRLEAGPSGEVIAAVLISGPSALQIGAFAAPRSEGIWADVRGELLSSIHQQGGSGAECGGSFGTELVAQVPGERGRQTVRFVGVDGPRWFLRGAFSGPAATNPGQAAALERSLREIVVVRGEEPMPVRDPLPLAMPAEVLAGQGDDTAPPADAQTRSAPPVPQRGPEITEIR